MKKISILFVMTAVMITLGTVYAYSVFRLPIEGAYEVSNALSGMPYMVALASYALCMFITGRFLKEINMKRFYLLGSTLVIAGWFFSSLTTHLWELVVSYGILIGSGVGVLYGIPIALAGKWFPNRKGLFTGIILGGFGLSPLMTAPIASYFIENMGLHDAFRNMSLLFSVVLFFGFWFVILPKDSPSSYEGVPVSTLVKEPYFRRLYFCFTLGTMAGLLAIGMTSIIGVHHYGLTQKELIPYIAFFSICNAVGRPIYGALTETLGVKRVTTMANIWVLVASSMVLLPITHKGVFLIVFALLWMHLGAWLAIAPMATMKAYGEKGNASRYGFLFTAYGVGAIMGVYGSGKLYEMFNSPEVVFAVIMAFMGLSLTQSRKL